MEMEILGRKQGWAIMTYRAESSVLKKSLKKAWDLKRKKMISFPPQP